MTTSGNGLQFNAPKSAASFTGKTRARVTKAEFASSKFGGKQIKFDWITVKNNRVITFMTIDSPKQIALYMAAGVIFWIDEENSIADVTPMDKQPLCELTLENGKLKALAPYTPQGEL